MKPFPQRAALEMMAMLTGAIVLSAELSCNPKNNAQEAIVPPVNLDNYKRALTICRMVGRATRDYNEYESCAQQVDALYGIDPPPKDAGSE